MFKSKRAKKLTIYALILAAIFLPGTIKYCKLYRQRQVNEAKIRMLAEENRRLKEDPVYIEKTARENLVLAKKGEFVVKFKDTAK